MEQKTLFENQGVELCVSQSGIATLYHRGPLPHEYIWAQYDQESKEMHFITDDGEVQALGMTIHKPFHEPLMKAREMFLIEVDEHKKYSNPKLIKFTALVDRERE